jgi:DNA-binding PadR family transcriptional regulator
MLSLLEIGPASGYELAHHRFAAVDHLWSATQGQVYTTLHKLVADGLVDSAPCETGTRGRIIYRLTTAGEAELEAWRSEDTSYLPNREPFLLRMSYIAEAPLDATLRNIDEHERRFTRRAELLEQIAETLLEGGYELLESRRGHVSEPDLLRVRAARAAVCREVAIRARAEVESARRLRALALELHGATVSAQM